MGDSYKESILVCAMVVLIFAILVSGVLVGQALRNSKAATVTPDEFTMSFVAPRGYKCVLTEQYDTSNVVVIQCKP